MGDPAGIGAEISAKVFANPALYEECCPLLVGDAAVMEQAVKIVNVPLKIHKIEEVEQARFAYGEIDVLHLPCVDMEQFAFGKVSPMCGNAAFQ